VFESGSDVQVEWSSYDDSEFPNNAVSIELSTMIVPYNYEIVVDNISNDGSASFISPNINTNTASLKIYLKDYYGNESIDIMDGFFAIGNDLSFVDTLAISSGTGSFVIDQISPDVTWVYPNGEEEFEANDVIELQWDISDDSFDSTDVTIELSQETGFDFEIEFLEKVQL
jgi:hypothetical protein